MQNVGKYSVPGNVVSLCGEQLLVCFERVSKTVKIHPACVVMSVSSHETNRFPLRDFHEI
jgi:hypothetical protein